MAQSSPLERESSARIAHTPLNLIDITIREDEGANVAPLMLNPTQRREGMMWRLGARTVGQESGSCCVDFTLSLPPPALTLNL